MSEPPNIVYIIEDDAAVRDAIQWLLRSVGTQAQGFGSTHEFLQWPRPDLPSCLILDIRLPGRSGLDFQRELAQTKIQIPIIFITGHGDIAMSVQAMKAGAVEFLTKPFRDQDLLDAVQAALERDRVRRSRLTEVSMYRERVESLSPRERAVFSRVVDGVLNKQIAAEMGISEAAVKVYRSQMMRKMGANSLAQLVKTVQKFDIPT